MTYVAQDRIEIPIGSQFRKVWPLTDADTGGTADMTGWSARCEVREYYGGPLITNFHADRVGHYGWPGVITFDGVGNVILTLDATVTATLSPIDNAVFDLELLAPVTGKPWRVVQGKAFITPEVTTDA